jgi:anti-sigma factor (TIGR02949 family)
MKDCRETSERLTPYVDDALPPEERTDIERHLTACPPCRQSADEEQGGRTIVRECASRLRQSPLPPGLRSRCEALARDHSRVSTIASWRARLVPLSVIATLVIVAGIALFSLATRRSNAVLAAQLTADHITCFKVFTPDQEIDAGQVEAQLEDKYDWEFHVPPSSTEGDVRLVGGRRCMSGEGPVPHVMYTTGDEKPISLFRLEGVNRDEESVSTMGHLCRIWSRGGNTYVLVVPESAAKEIDRIASYVKVQAR